MATDIDATAAHMTYIQLSLYHVPAVVHIGNTLANTVRETFYTPAHVMGGWSRKLQRREDAQVNFDAPLAQTPELHALGAAPDPATLRVTRQVDNTSSQPQLTLF